MIQIFGWCTACKVEQVRLGEPVGCGYDYTTNGGGTNSDATDIPQVYTLRFEDMTREAGDFDFNDVVLKVTVPDESGKATVTLFAAGAAKNLKVDLRIHRTGQILNQIIGEFMRL